MNVRYSRRARDDLKRILAYVNERSSSGSRSIRHAVRTSAGLIARFPEIGRLSGEAGTRVLPIGRYPYLIYWTIVDGVPTIVHIRHAARTPF